LIAHKIEILPCSNPAMDSNAGQFDVCHLEPINAPGSIQGWGALLIADDAAFMVKHVSANLVDVLGVASADALGRPLASLIGPEDLIKLLAGDIVKLRPRKYGLPRLAASAHRLDGQFYVEMEPARGHGDGAVRLRAPRTIRALKSASSKAELFAVAIAELRRITGFDRVHVYRFDPDGHGEVIAEVCAPDLHKLLGLRFPAMYIPPPAHEILTRIAVRVIADVEAVPVPLFSANEDEPSPDLSLCLLRSAARCCTGFFRNMGLRASVSIALTVEGRLWGVLSCHHRSAANLSPAARGLCEVIGEIASMKVATLREQRGQAGRAQRRKFFDTLATRIINVQDDPAALAVALADEAPGLLSLCDAAGAIIRLGGRTLAVGQAPPQPDLLLDALLGHAPADGAPAAWDTLGHLLPDDALPGIAGALILKLHHGNGDAIAWLRPPQAFTVRWGSAPSPTLPDKMMQRVGAAASAQTFSVWQQEVHNRCVPWQPEQLNAALEVRRELDRLMAGYVEAMRIARATAERAMRAKSQFLATMSHEIRSPMSGLLGVLELLRGTELSEEQRRMAGMIHDSGSMLLAVLNDILDFSKIEAGAVSIAPAPVALRSFIAALVEPIAAAAAAGGLTLQAIIDPDIPDAILTDPLRLRQILGNLLSNAVKFTKSGSITLRADNGTHVDFATESPASTLRFRVRDSGIGMSQEVIDRLFTPFMQADGSTTRNYGGTGLGLCISHELVRLLGGELLVTSEMGAGSEFSFRIPLVLSHREIADSRTPDASVAAILPNGKRILIVDDDATLRWLAQRQLRKLGCAVDTAENGEAGLQRLRHGGYDLLLTDCHMPLLDGVGLTQAVRTGPDAALQALPIIGLTADVTEEQRARCIAAGMTELAIKPLTIERLSEILRRHLSPESPPPAPSAPALRSIPFDDQIFLSTFPRGDPVGAAWLTEWVEQAHSDVRELGGLVAGEACRPALRTLAHRLAGASFSTGAMRLGEAARALERAGPEAEQAELETLHAAVDAELAASAAAIAAFLAPPG
jgi:light-regulated signal transduction histidine kinase (bacteriophytochrome)/CheY-like chemotaxis protein/HPt (histidine-containing phosphotransfer) domain-containing protein